MFKIIRQFFTPPVFPDDEDKARTARVLYALLANMLVVVALAAIATIFVFVYKTRTSILILALFCFLLSSRALVQRGRVREASALFVIGMWIVCTFMFVIGGRITTAFAAIHVSIAVITGILLGRRSAILLAALSTLVSLGLTLLQSADYYPLGYSPPAPPISHWAMLVLAFISVITALNLTLQGSAQALARARKSEKQFRLLAENSTDMISRQTPEGVYLYVSPAYRVLLGYEPEELVGHSAFEFIHPEDIPAADEFRLTIIAQPIISTTVFRARQKNGGYVWLETTSHTVMDKEPGAVLEIHATSRDITARKQVEEKLRQMNERYVLATYAASLGVWDWDIQTNELIWDDRMYELYGRKRADFALPYEAWLNGLHPDDVARCNAESELARRGEKEYDTEFRVVWPSGAIHHLKAYGQVIRDAHGIPLRMIGINYDITERKRAEEALRQSEELHRAFFENGPDGVVILDPETAQPIQFNDQVCRQLGYTREEFGRLYLSDIEAVETAEDSRARIQKVMREGRDDFVTRQRTKQGEIRYVHVTAQSIDAGGHPIYQCIWRDITKQKQAEEALHESEKMFRIAFDDAPTGMSIIGAAGFTYLAVNPLLCKMFGYTKDEFLGNTIKLVTHPDDVERSNAWIKKKYNDEPCEPEFEKRYFHKDGHIVWGLVRAQWIRNEDGSPRMAINHILDITERKRAEEEIRNLNAELGQRVDQRTAELQAVNKELEAFSYSVSHDLRAPLRSINGFGRILQEDYADKLDTGGQRYLQLVRTSSQRMGELIEDLLSLSRLTRSELHHQVVDLSALAQSVMDALRQADPERDAEIVITPGMHACGDERLLRIVFENLLGNAWKFTAKHPCARIEVGVTVHEGAVTYFVRDDGAGFDMQYANKLFGAFQRLHAETEFEGTGIGLATVQRIIHRHGGQVWAEGAMEQGATFYFTLPSK